MSSKRRRRRTLPQNEIVSNPDNKQVEMNKNFRVLQASSTVSISF